MQEKIKIDKMSQGLFCIFKDESFQFIIGMSYGLYLEFLRTMNQELNEEAYQTSKTFIGILERVLIDDEFAMLDDKELMLLSNWISNICYLMLKAEGIDFGNEQILKYFRLAQDFVKKSKEATSYLQ